MSDNKDVILHAFANCSEIFIRKTICMLILNKFRYIFPSLFLFKFYFFDKNKRVQCGRSLTTTLFINLAVPKGTWTNQCHYRCGEAKHCTATDTYQIDWLDISRMILSMIQRSSKQSWSEAIQQLKVEYIICYLPERTILVTLEKKYLFLLFQVSSI